MGTSLASREDLEALEASWLAAYACHAVHSRGRVYPETPSENRSCFQRDRDRIIHSRAFRRLKHKTQVFVSVEGDHYRTRLTHTLEVVHISRHLARLLRLNEDLCECIALAHDLGHPPFGHAGETVLALKMKDHGGFEHNLQSKRIIETLEKRSPLYPGLNLSFEVRHGLLKHGGGRSDHPQAEAEPRVPLESQLVDLSDEIAYTNHDMDDGLRAGLLDLGALAQLTLWKQSTTVVRAEYQTIDTATQVHLTISHMIGVLVRDAAAATLKNIQCCGIQTGHDVYKAPTLAVFSESLAPLFLECKHFLKKNFYQHPRVQEPNQEKQKILATLFDAYIRKRPDAIDANTDCYRAVCDYISGMTDTFAEKCFDKLTND